MIIFMHLDDVTVEEYQIEEDLTMVILKCNLITLKS